MTQQPVWLRGESSYRLYVWGLRLSLLAFAGAALFLLLGASGVVGTWLPTIGILAALAVAIPAVPAGMIGWLRIPGRNRVNAHQGAFLRMLGRDIVKGIPAARSSRAR